MNISYGRWVPVILWTVLAVGAVGGEKVFTAESAEVSLTADQVVERANHAAYYQGEDGSAVVSMEITDDKGRKQTREFTILRRNDPPVEGGPADGGQKFYVYFHRPSDVKKMVFMVWKHLDKDDDRWLYLPALDLVKRIAASDERTSFVGSDFFYEDVSGRGIHEDGHEMEETTANYYVLKHTPKDPSAVEFAYYRTWIHRTTFIPVKIEYYDSKGEKYRVYEALKVETISGFPTVVQSKMSNLLTGGVTTLGYSKVQYHIGLKDEIFTERFLRKPPEEYIR